MKSLKETREELNEIDHQLTRLYQERMHLMKDVAEYKKENNLPIYDNKREEEVIKTNLDLLEDSSLKPYYTEFIKFLMDQGKDLQKRFLESNG